MSGYILWGKSVVVDGSLQVKAYHAVPADAEGASTSMAAGTDLILVSGDLEAARSDAPPVVVHATVAEFFAATGLRPRRRKPTRAGKWVGTCPAGHVVERTRLTAAARNGSCPECSPEWSADHLFAWERAAV